MRVNTTPQETLSQPLHRGHLSAEPSAPANTPFQHLGQRPLPQGSKLCVRAGYLSSSDSPPARA